MDIYWKDEYHPRLPKYLFTSLLFAFCDILVLPASFIGCLSPTRFVRGWNLWWNFIRCKCCGYKELSHDTEELVNIFIMSARI